MNMSKKRRPVYYKEKKKEEIPMVAGIEINRFRMYFNEFKYYIMHFDLPKSEYMNEYVNYERYTVERFTGMTDYYGIPIFEGDIVYQKSWIGGVEIENWYFVCWNEENKCFIARYCDNKGVVKFSDLSDKNGYISIMQEWLAQKIMVGNIHYSGGFFQNEYSFREFNYDPFATPYNEFVADREVCMELQKNFPDAFNKSFFTWIYYPFKCEWRVKLREYRSYPYERNFPAPIADEILSELPSCWHGIDEKDFAEKYRLNSGIVSAETDFNLQIEKNSFNEIFSQYVVDNGRGASGFREEVKDTQKLSTALLGAWFFMKKNKKQS